MKSSKSILWYLHRLRVMKPAEVLHRVQESWRQRTEPAFLKALDSFDLGSVVRSVPELPNKVDAPQAWLDQLRADTELLQKGEWQLFGWHTTFVGTPPQWHRDVFTGTEIPVRGSAHRLNHRHLPGGADVRSVWEINRWAEMTRLGMQAWLNDDEQALKTAQLWLVDWCDQNPPGQGINWTSPLEVALRLINFVWFDALVTAFLQDRHSDDIRIQQTELVRRIVPLHTAWTWRYKSAGSSANNHLLGELVALVMAVSRWPALEKISCSSEITWKSLEREILHQFAEDGGSKEQALHYHLFAFDLAWQAVLVMKKKHGAVYERLRLAADYFQSLAHGQEPWDFGDNDDAQVVPVTLQRAEALSEWQSWFRGESNGLQFWLGQPPSTLPAEPFRFFKKSGTAVVEHAGWKVRVDASPLGFGSLAAHGHGDAMHVSLWDQDKALLIDPGTGGYYGHAAWRAELADWSAHNGPVPVEGYRTPRRMGAFLWMDHHAVPTLSGEASHAEVSFEHEGYSFCRKVEISDAEVRVEDTESSGKAFVVRLIFSPACTITQMAGGYRLSQGGKSWELLVSHGSLSKKKVSSAYGKAEEAWLLTLECLSGPLSWLVKRTVS